MAYVKCAKCGIIKENVATLKEAQQLATLHYRMNDGAHLFTFGYEGEAK
jgi:hypothetical protein